MTLNLWSSLLSVNSVWLLQLATIAYIVSVLRKVDLPLTGCPVLWMFSEFSKFPNFQIASLHETLTPVKFHVSSCWIMVTFRLHVENPKLHVKLVITCQGIPFHSCLFVLETMILSAVLIAFVKKTLWNCDADLHSSSENQEMVTLRLAEVETNWFGHRLKLK